MMVAALILLATALQLHHQGREWWCVCGTAFIWISDAWGSQTSQAFLDPYSFTHILHGLAFAGLLTLTLRRIPWAWQFVIAIAIESTWEITENTNAVIDRYREATAALGYHGDSVFNSLGDIACCGLGFVIAKKLGWWRSVVVFAATEVVLLITIRDSLLLEILMLVFPIQSIKDWQIAP
jgi:Protein of unknown function (DUF2585)